MIIFYITIFIIIMGYLYDTWLSYINYNNRNSEIPLTVNDIYNKDEYKKWLSYTMENFKINKLTSLINLLLILSFILFKLFPKIHNFAQNISNNELVQSFILIGVYGLTTLIIGIPFSYYKNFKIEEKYGFNKTTIKIFITDTIKNLILSFILFGIIISLFYFGYVVLNENFFMVTWLGSVILINAISMLYSKVITPLFNKQTPLEDGELKEAIIEFSEKVGYDINNIYIIDASKRSTKLNAYFTGLGKTKRVVLYDTLIDKLSTEEIIAVLAHEIGHSEKKHLLKSRVVSAIYLAIFIYILGFILGNDLFSQAFGFKEANFGFGLLLFNILITPLAVILNTLQYAFSRKNEFEADKFAKDNGYGEHLISALKVLAKENFANLTPHPLYVKLTYSHPPIHSRINKLK